MRVKKFGAENNIVLQNELGHFMTYATDSAFFVWSIYVEHVCE